MESNIAKELNGKFNPIVLLKTNEKPENAIGPKSNGRGCIMPFIAQVIANRKTAIFSKDKCSCFGAITGFGFGNGFKSEGAGLDNYAAFLSLGKEVAKNQEGYDQFCSNKPSHVREMFEKGERIFSTYENAYNFVSKRDIYDNEEKYVVFKPIEDLKEDEIPSSIIFTVNPLELSALIHLDGSRREDVSYTMTPQASACQAIGNHIFSQSESDNPHATLGLLDLAGRRAMRRWIPDEYLNYSLPWELFLELENLSKTSLFQSTVWKEFKK